VLEGFVSYARIRLVVVRMHWSNDAGGIDGTSFREKLAIPIKESQRYRACRRVQTTRTVAALVPYIDIHVDTRIRFQDLGFASRSKLRFTPDKPEYDDSRPPRRR